MHLKEMHTHFPNKSLEGIWPYAGHFWSRSGFPLGEYPAPGNSLQDIIQHSLLRNHALKIA